MISVIAFTNGLNIIGLFWPKYEGVVSSITKEEYPVSTIKYGTVMAVNIKYTGTYFVNKEPVTFEFTSRRKPKVSENEIIIFHKSKSGIIVFDPPNWSMVMMVSLFTLLTLAAGISQLIEFIHCK